MQWYLFNNKKEQVDDREYYMDKPQNYYVAIQMF